jgi:hypothetical protein
MAEKEVIPIINAAAIPIIFFIESSMRSSV